MHIHYLQHVPFENAGFIKEWALKHNHTISKTQLFADQSLPDINSFDLLVIMGGPMNIYEYEKYPWLKKEKAYISKCIASDKKILGVCLGAQLIADCLEAKTTKNHIKEIGWFETKKITTSSKLNTLLPDTFTPLHWHGDTFAIPEGALHIAESKACKNQAFIYKEKIIGFQFHLEATLKSLSALYKNCSDEIDDSFYMQNENQLLGNEKYFTDSNAIMTKILTFLSET